MALVSMEKLLKAAKANNDAIGQLSVAQHSLRPCQDECQYRKHQGMNGGYQKKTGRRSPCL
nr:hypothetical protein [Evansella caseinilytica]